MLTRLLASSTLVTLLATTTAFADDRDRKKSELEGNWKLTRIIKGGIADTDAKAIGGRITIKDGKITAYDPENKQQYVIEYRIHEDRNPREIDMKIVEGRDKGKSAEGIYMMEGDSLRICYAFSGGKRPKNFKTSAGEQEIFLEMKRERR